MNRVESGTPSVGHKWGWRVGGKFGVTVWHTRSVAVSENPSGELTMEECGELSFIFRALAETGHLPEHIYLSEEVTS